MSQDIRLLHVMAGRPHGGAEEFFTRLVIALHQRGVCQELIIRRDPVRAARLAANGVDCHQSRFGVPWLDMLTHVRLRKVISDFRPTLLLSWMNRATDFVAPHARHRNPRFAWAARLGGYYNLKYYRHCDYLIGNTPDIVDYFIAKNWPPTRTQLLPNFAGNETLPPLARAQFDTPEHAPLFLALGRLHPNKAFDTLLDAAAQVPGAYVWLAGEGEERAALKAQAHRLRIQDRIRFLGWRADVPALYASADFFICPSRHEPLGNVVLEAMAAARPIIAAKSQGPSQLIENGKTGILVTIDDARAMAAAMQKMITDSAAAQQLAVAARESYLQHYSEDSICEKYLSAFRRMQEGS